MVRLGVMPGGGVAGLVPVVGWARTGHEISAVAASMVPIEAYLAMAECLPLGHASNGLAPWRVAPGPITKERAAGTGLARIAVASHSSSAMLACGILSRAEKHGRHPLSLRAKRSNLGPSAHLDRDCFVAVAPRNDTGTHLRSARPCRRPRAQHLQLDRLYRPRGVGALPEGNRCHHPLRRIRQ